MPDFHRIRALVHTYGDLFGDLGDLLRKELRLGEVELKLGLANLTQAAVLFVASGMIALFAVLLLLLGIVHLIASFGLAFAVMQA
jgi:site-specific recombinase